MSRTGCVALPLSLDDEDEAEEVEGEERGNGSEV